MEIIFSDKLSEGIRVSLDDKVIIGTKKDRMRLLA
ncbi:hypothetical protein BhaS171_00036 [Bacillus phage vB_BhaS-171]|nr:hypothetical protein BH781_gp36 [Bacillus phage vB_BhaS-171]ALY08092.1 hypothetical protein BhaS171_00036 [Bacillus phage vB_BhaS-171]